MPASSQTNHPGPYIRQRILPKGMSVTEAARLLGVGRPALSNLLNANASLSAEMAARIERAFGANADELIDMQAKFDAADAKGKNAAAFARSYVPPFLQIKANDIESWAQTITARSRLAVLLRTLVHSTGLHITAVDFPGNDDSERPGWDGFVEAREATPWVPLGKSGWEFGVNASVKEKADHDYDKSVRHLSAEKRAEITFVFVTPRRWKGKIAWQEQRRASKHWKDVRVYDASDIEQWLEQSIPGQAWFAQECHAPAQGVLSLDGCWEKWCADCEPRPVEALFDEAIAGAKDTVITKLTKSAAGPIIVTADSRGEALAFLHCLFAADRPELAALRDRIVVFEEPGPLSRLASKSASFVPVVASREVEKEFAPHRKHLPAIIVYPRNAPNADPDVSLEPLGYSAFDSALQAMGCDSDDVQRLARESGRSLTVLRRRLSKLDAIRTPEWASNMSHARALIPFLFAGAWKSNNGADQTVLELFADGTAYATLEVQLAQLRQLDDPPVWSVGSFRGLISKIDTLFAINRSITCADLDRFFSVAELVLAEDDPSLDLPEDKRWAAGIYGKTREISKALRDGVGKTLLHLTVDGPALFDQRLGTHLESEARRLIDKLLSPLTARKLEAHSADLPLYAETSPDGFLRILEADLALPDPEALKLMRPVSSGVFGHCPRVGLLWALETAAWAPETLIRTIDILARLAKPVIDDNWLHKPGASLSAIFHRWMPQTGANLEQRIAALEYLVEHHPKVAWPICVEQFDQRLSVGDYSHKPRWRRDARGHGEPVTDHEASTFAHRAVELALDWKPHTRETLGDLIASLGRPDDTSQTRVWDLVDQWAETATDEDRAWLREKLRRACQMRAVHKKSEDSAKVALDVARARRAYDHLKPTDLLLQHAWLFRSQWVELSADDLAEVEPDFEKHDEDVAAKRIEAVRAVVADRGVEGALALAEMGDAGGLIGAMLPRILTTVAEQMDAIRTLLSRGPLSHSLSCQSVIAGLLRSLSDDDLVQVLTRVTRQRETAETVALLILAPFGSVTWRFADTLGADIEAAYWTHVRAMSGRRLTDEELPFAVDRLLAADRPRAAFWVAQVELERLQPQQLFRLMKTIATRSGEPSDTYKLADYEISQAFELLNQSGEIGVDDMAGLEFMYLDAFYRDEDRLPNLERQIEQHPELFVQAIAFAFRRKDTGEDPAEWCEPNPDVAKHRAQKTYKLLEKISRIPGHNQHGELEPQRLLDWVRKVKTSCADLARGDICDFVLGRLFAKAPVGKDGVWPCEPVREVLQQVATERLAEGITNGLYNSRGIHGRGEGGDQERELAAKYDRWARAVEFTHPRVARILKKMVRRYEHEAQWQDTEAGVRRRLLY